MPQQMDDELLQQAQAGEESAIAALITAMMPAIRKGAAAVAAPGLDFVDAVQEGLIGLFQHGGAALVGNGKLFRPRRGRIFRQGHTVVQRSMLFAGK